MLTSVGTLLAAEACVRQSMQKGVDSARRSFDIGTPKGMNEPDF